MTKTVEDYEAEGYHVGTAASDLLASLPDDTIVEGGVDENGVHYVRMSDHNHLFGNPTLLRNDDGTAEIRCICPCGELYAQPILYPAYVAELERALVEYTRRASAGADCYF